MQTAAALLATMCYLFLFSMSSLRFPASITRPFWNDCNHNMRILAALSLASCAVLARPFTPAGGRFATLLPSPRRTTTSSLMGGGPFDIFNEGKKAFVKSLAGDYDAIAVRTKIDSLIKDNSVLMLSFTTCPYCIKAKSILDDKGAKYKVIELDKESDGKAVRAEMGTMLGRTSVPAIWINGVFIGGCNDGPSEYNGINNLNSQNKLDGMLKSAGAI